MDDDADTWLESAATAALASPIITTAVPVMQRISQ